MKGFIICMFLLCVMWSVDASCFQRQAQYNITQTGKIIAYCNYRGLELLAGSYIRTADCFECRCETVGLDCCGIGIKAGVIGPPPGCKVIADGCDPILVQVEDERKKCLK